MTDTKESYLENLYNKLKNIFETPSLETTSTNDIVYRLPEGLSVEKIDSEIKSIISKETGIDRIKKLFEYESVANLDFQN